MKFTAEAIHKQAIEDAASFGVVLVDGSNLKLFVDALA